MSRTGMLNKYRVEYRAHSPTNVLPRNVPAIEIAAATHRDAKERAVAVLIHGMGFPGVAILSTERLAL